MNIQFKTSEVLILLAASVMSFLANLPDSFVGNIIDKKVLLAALTALIVVALVRYLQMFLLVLISILAIGVNLPQDLASALGISQMALMVSLGILIAVALLNRATKVLPVVSEASYTGENDMREAIMAAIEKGDQAALHRMLTMNAKLNFIFNGTTPLHLAAERGYPDIVRLLIKYGADFRKRNSEGKTALEIALAKKKFIKTTEILHDVSQPYFANSRRESRHGDAEIWQKQHGY